MSAPIGGLPIFGTLYPAGNLPIIDGGNAPIHNVANPSLPQDVATKAYVDASSSGLSIRPAVKAMSTANVASLTGTTTQDGIALVNGDRVLLPFQTTQSDNGPWVIGSPWTRPTDFVNGSHGGSAFFFVQQGTNHADEGWVCTANAPTDIVGTDALPFTQFSAAGVVVADEVTLHKAGSVMSVKALGIGDAQISSMSPSKLSSASAGIGQTLIWGGSTWAPGSAPRFSATFYVDPAFTGTSNGSQSAPYTSITLAIAAAPSTGARIVLAPLANTVEDVTLPTSGNWEIASDFTGSGRDVATVISKITGNIVCTSANLVLTNVWVTGTITGNATNTVSGHTLTLKNTFASGAVTLTASTGAFWLTFLNGDMAWPNGNVGCVLTGAYSVAGNVAANNAYFGSTISVTSVNRLINCRLNGNVTIAGPSDQLVMLGCTWPNNPLLITGAGATGVVMDGYTASSKFTLSGCVLQLRNNVTPFRATFYVDPLFITPSEGGGGGTGGSTGTPSNPFISIAAAIAAAPSTGALIILAPGANTTENVTFPTTGSWEIKCEAVGRATITGNVICSAPVQTSCRLTNIVVTGTVTGLASNPTANAANFVVLTNSQVLGALTLTQSSNGFWFVMLRGLPTNFFSLGGAVVGACTVQGQLFANNWAFGGAITTNSIGSLDFCRVPGGSSLITLTGGSLTITNTTFTTTPQFVGGSVAMDGYSYARAQGTAMSLSGTTFSLFNIAGQFAATYHVNPAYTGASNGSAGAPFTSINAAIAVAPLTGSLIVLASGTHSASVTFPASGVYTLTAARDRLATDVVVSGAISVPVTANVTFSCVQISGNITYTGTSGSGSYLILDRTVCSGNITATSGGFVNVLVKSTAVAKSNIYTQGWTTGTINILGRFIAEKALVQSDVTAGAVLANDTEFSGVHTINTLNPAGISAPFGMDLRGGCSFTAGWTYTGPVSGSVRISDPATALNWANTLPTLTNATTLVYGFQNQLSTLAQGGATTNQVLTWNGTAWAPASTAALVFQTLTNLTAFNATGVANATVAKLATPSDAYELVIAPTAAMIAATDGVNVVQPTTPNTYRWIRSGLINSFADNWYLDPAGSDANDGKAAITPLKTSEELSRRLSPGGQFFIPKQNTVINAALGSYGSLTLGLSFPVGSAFTFKIVCAFTSSAPITLASAVNTVISTTPTRGRITTASGTFVDKKRIRSTSGANIGAITYSTGLTSATDTFTKTWFQESSISNVSIANGTTCVVDTLGVTFSRVQIRTSGHSLGGSFTISDAILPSGIDFANTVGGSAGIVLSQCQIGTGAVGEIARISGNIQLRNCRFLAETTAYLGLSEPILFGCVFETNQTLANECISLQSGNCFNGCGLKLGGVITFITGAGVHLGDCEWVNGSGSLTAITASRATCGILIAGQQYGFGTSYAVGLNIGSGTTVAATAVSLLNILATQQVVMVGNNLNYSDLPKAYPVSACAFTLETDATAVSFTVGNAVSVGAANSSGTAKTISLSDHTHAVTDLAIASQARGDLIFFNGTNWVRLAAGTSGTFLKTLGSGADPAWSTFSVGALTPGTDGQALITTGGVPAWGNDFGAQNLTTTGSLLGVGLVQFGSTQASPSVKQANTAVVNAVGQTLTIQAQTATGGGTSVGGKLVLASGAGVTTGAVEIKAAGNLLFDFGTTAVGTITIGSTIFALNLNSSSPLAINAGGGIYQFKAAELALSTNVELLSFGSTSAPVIKLLDNASAGFAGGLFTVQGQDATGTGATTGGKLLLRSGTGVTAGDLELRAGGVQGLLLTATTTVLGVNGRVTTVNSATGMALQIASATQLTLAAGLASFVAGGVLSTTDNAVNASTGATWTLRGQNSTGTGATVGGKLLLASGTGATAGDVELAAGSGNVILTSTALVKVGSPHISFTGSSAIIDLQNLATNSATGGLLTLHGQDCTGTTSVGGGVLFRAGTGTSRAGNIAFHAVAANDQGMAGGIFLGKITTLPTGDPANGLFMWSGPGGELTTRSTVSAGGGTPVMRIGDGTTDMVFNIESLSGTGSYSFDFGGVPVMTVGVGGTILHGPVLLGGTFEFGAPRTLATSGTFNLFTIEGQGGFTTGTFTTGSLLLRAGDAGAGGTSAQTGGDVLIRGGFGGVTTTNGNIALGTDATPNWQGGSGIIFVANSTVVPGGNPSVGAYVYADAGAMKARGASGTITTFGPADPHCPTCGRDFAFEWRNDEKGEHLAICATCLVNTLHEAGHDRSKFAFVHKIKHTAP